MEGTVGPVNDGWQRVSVVKYTPVFRTGWHGVWDALVAAITRSPRFTITEPIEISAWVKAAQAYGEPAVYICGVKVQL